MITIPPHTHIFAILLILCDLGDLDTEFLVENDTEE